MKTEDIMEKIQDVFREVLDDETLEIREGTVPGDIDDWDSLSHVILIVALEKEFEVKFKITELQTLVDVGDMARLVVEKLGNSNESI